MKSTVRLDIVAAIVYIIIYITYKNSNKCKIVGNDKLCPYDVLFMAALGIFFIGGLMSYLKVEKDPLTIDYGIISNFDSWAVFHIAFYFVLGCMFPDRYLLFLVIGILWEIFEHYSGKHNMKLFGINAASISDNASTGWVKGKVLDVVVNMVGYIVGSYFIQGKLNSTYLLKEFFD